MKTKRLVKIAAGTVVTLSVIALGGRLSTPPSVEAQDNFHNHGADDEASLVRIGFEISPVPLNLEGRDPWKVGLGSFLVNAVGDCNGCHTGGNPYFAQPTKTDPLTWKAVPTLAQPSHRCRASIHRRRIGCPPGHTWVRTSSLAI
jgi:hypothetical protein